jgi:hypothetical protein
VDRFSRDPDAADLRRRVLSSPPRIRTAARDRHRSRHPRRRGSVTAEIVRGRRSFGTAKTTTDPDGAWRRWTEPAPRLSALQPGTQRSCNVELWQQASRSGVCKHAAIRVQTRFGALLLRAFTCMFAFRQDPTQGSWRNARPTVGEKPGPPRTAVAPAFRRLRGAAGPTSSAPHASPPLRAMSPNWYACPRCCSLMLGFRRAM